MQPSCVPDPGVEDGVKHIYAQIGEDDDESDQDVNRLDDRVVVGVDRRDVVAAHAGNRIDLLDDDGATNEHRKLQTHDGDNGNERIAEGVADDDDAFAQALGPGGADVVLAQRLEHGGAGEAHDAARQGAAENDGGHGQHLYVGDRVIGKGDVGDRRHAPLEVTARHADEHDPGPEARDRQEAAGNAAPDVVPEAVLPDCRKDANGDGHERGEEDG